MPKRHGDDGATAPAGQADVEAYLAALPDDQRRALMTLRATIKATAPMTERISYGIPTCRLHGRPLVGFGATKNHCSFHLMSTGVMESHRDELAGYDTGKGTIRFPSGAPPPDALVRRLVEARITENERPRTS
jgi:uncharacterized protein YdhG (YjbR/CyaY superfamily)